MRPDTGKAGERPKAAPKTEAMTRAAPAEAVRKDDDVKRAEAILNADVLPNKDNARALEAKLAKAGVKYYTETVTTPGGEQTRVRAGPFPTKEAAEKSRERLKGLGLSPGAVIARQ